MSAPCAAGFADHQQCRCAGGLSAERRLHRSSKMQLKRKRERERERERERGRRRLQLKRGSEQSARLTLRRIRHPAVAQSQPAAWKDSASLGATCTVQWRNDAGSVLDRCKPMVLPHASIRTSLPNFPSRTVHQGLGKAHRDARHARSITEAQKLCSFQDAGFPVKAEADASVQQA